MLIPRAPSLHETAAILFVLSLAGVGLVVLTLVCK